MSLIYIVGFIFIVFLSLRSIAKSLKKGANSYEYSKEEMRANADIQDYVFSRK